MARNKRPERPATVEEPSADLVEKIVDDVVRTATMPTRQWMALSPFPQAPLAIPTASGGEYRVTQNGVDAAHRLCRRTWDEREDLRQRFTRREFDKLSFRAIGETLLNARRRVSGDAQPSDPVGSATYAALADDYAAHLGALVEEAGLDVDRHVPCHLFHADQNVPAFAVGPVSFRPRRDWIDAFVQDPPIRAHVDRVEDGTLPMKDLEREALRSGSPRPLYGAWRVLCFLGDHPWVATVRMAGHGDDQSHHKASVFVGLAIDAIGIRFYAGDARRLVRAEDRRPPVEERFATSKGGKILYGTSIEPPGLRSAPGKLAAEMAAERPFLDAAGILLQAYADAHQAGRAPHLVERWANALHWTGEARRETSDFMAVVDYGCAADGLSNAGVKALDMTRFAEAALAQTDGPIPAGSIPVAQAVTIVYGEGRNKLAHGEDSGLLEDHASARATGDALMARLFEAVTPAFAKVVANRPDILALRENHAYLALEAVLRGR